MRFFKTVFSMYCLYIKTLFTTISTTFFIIFRSVDKIDVKSMTKDMKYLRFNGTK